MNDRELIAYMDICKANRRYIFVLPTDDMFTKKGTLRKRWLHMFFEIDAEAEKTMPKPESGGCIDEGIAIYVPDHNWFHLMSYNRDLDGWEKYIHAIADYRNTLCARVDQENLILSNGAVFRLSDCKIDAYNPTPVLRQLPF